MSNITTILNTFCGTPDGEKEKRNSNLNVHGSFDWSFNKEKKSSHKIGIVIWQIGISLPFILAVGFSFA